MPLTVPRIEIVFIKHLFFALSMANGSATVLLDDGSATIMGAISSAMQTSCALFRVILTSHRLGVKVFGRCVAYRSFARMFRFRVTVVELDRAHRCVTTRFREEAAFDILTLLPSMPVPPVGAATAGVVMAGLLLIDTPNPFGGRVRNSLTRKDDGPKLEEPRDSPPS